MTSSVLNEPLSLPCGATLPNRIAKAAMSEHLASTKQSPGRGLVRLYERWSAGGAGLLITGNVMIDRAHLEGVRNVAIGPDSNIDRFREWAEAGTVQGNHLWMQLNHPGRQTPRHLNPNPGAPSAVEPVNLFRRAKAFGKPHAMDEAEIGRAIRSFASAAAFAKAAGFTLFAWCDSDQAIAPKRPRRKGPKRDAWSKALPTLTVLAGEKFVTCPEIRKGRDFVTCTGTKDSVACNMCVNGRKNVLFPCH